MLLLLLQDLRVMNEIDSKLSVYLSTKCILTSNKEIMFLAECVSKKTQVMKGFWLNFQEMSSLAYETDFSILVLIQITVWIQEFSKDFFSSHS